MANQQSYYSQVNLGCYGNHYCSIEPDQNQSEHHGQSTVGDMVKAVVDIDHSIVVIGGKLHSDEEALLLEQGSLQRNLWAINLYPERSAKEGVRFDDQCASFQWKPFPVC